MITLNTNSPSVLTNRVGNSSSSSLLNKALTKLSSGMRINSAADDPSGLALATSLSASITTFSQSSRNAADTASALSVADGALTQVQDITGRLQELATASANGTLSDQQRQSLQSEFTALTDEIKRIGGTTSYNDKNLLDGSTFSTDVGGTSINAGGLNLGDLSSNVASQDISTQAGAQAAASAIEDFSKQLTSQRASAFDAPAARLSSASDSLSSAIVTSAQALSQISDANIGGAISDFSRAKVMIQYELAATAQRNQLQTSTIKQLIG